MTDDGILTGDAPADGGDARARELTTRLAQVQERIASACRAAGRERSQVGLVVVTKYFPADDVRRLRAAGVEDMGENRDQEAGPKVAELEATGERPERVHFIGQLQTNKAASVARYADVVQSVDRDRLVRALDRGAQAAERMLDVLVQVSLDEAQGRGGAAPGDVPRIADLVAGSDALRLRGVMAVAPLGGDPAVAFERLAEVSRRLRADHPEATTVSAGMSGDLETAVAAGSTLLRVGSAILGPRPVRG